MQRFLQTGAHLMGLNGCAHVACMVHVRCFLVMTIWRLQTNPSGEVKFSS